MLFVAPHQHPPGTPFGWFQPDIQHALFADRIDEPSPRLLGDTQMDLAAWREDGQLLGFGRNGADQPLGLQLLSSAGGSNRHLLDLPISPPSEYAAAWDGGRAQLLVSARNAEGGLEFWLVRLGLEQD
jgi:hypothetical protein